MIDDELQDWTDKSLNDTATEEELLALEERLLRDEQARDHYLNAVNIHASLQQRFVVVEEPASVVSFLTVARRKFGMGLAIAAGLAVLIAVSSILLNPASPPLVLMVRRKRPTRSVRLWNPALWSALAG